MSLFVGLDASMFPFGMDVLFVLVAGWTAFRVGLVWLWLRRRGHLDRVAGTLPLVR